MKALILVDIQNDFCPGGALAVADGDQVVSVANRLMNQFELVVSTQDWHPANHKSFASQNENIKVGELFELNGLRQIAWPDHCIQDTRGAEFAECLNQNGVTKIFPKGTDPDIDSYSGFYDNGHQKTTGMGDFLKSNGVTEVFVMGLATDYCVKFTALDAIELGYKTFVIIDGCRGVEMKQGDTHDAVIQMKQAGISIIESSIFSNSTT